MNLWKKFRELWNKEKVTYDEWVENPARVWIIGILALVLIIPGIAIYLTYREYFIGFMFIAIGVGIFIIGIIFLGVYGDSRIKLTKSYRENSEGDRFIIYIYKTKEHRRIFDTLDDAFDDVDKILRKIPIIDDDP